MAPSSSWQELLYPLGFLSSLPFFLRFFIQWIETERAGKSVLYASFWRFSMAGNLLLALHALIQQQFPLFVAQGIAGFIAIRNLQLMESKATPFPIQGALFYTVGLFTLYFVPFFWYGGESLRFLRVPIHAWQASTEASIAIHLVGIIGQTLFSFRFIVQWWQAEKDEKSFLSKEFWWISLLGGLFTMIYALLIIDPVNIVGPLFNLIPTIRNLLFLSRTNKGIA